MLTSSSTTLTFEVSTKPCCSTPRPFRSRRADALGVPEAAVSANRFWPLGSRPAGLTKLTSCIWPTVCGKRLARQRDADGAVVADGHALRIGRDGDAGLHVVAVVRHQLALGVDLERAVAGVAGGAVGHLDLEEAVAAHRHVQRVGGLLQVALAEAARGGHGARAQADLQPVGSVVCSLLLEPAWRRFWYIRSSNTACDFL